MLDAARRLVLARGVTATTMDAIATEAGVTKPVVYACFPSKRELVEALLRREEARLAELVAGSLQAKMEHDDFETAISAGFNSFFSAVAADPDSCRLLFTAELGPEPELRLALDRSRAMQTERIAEMITRGMRERDVKQPEGKALVVSSLIMGASEGAMKLLLTDPVRWPPDELAELLARLTVRGLVGLGGFT